MFSHLYFIYPRNLSNSLTVITDITQTQVIYFILFYFPAEGTVA